MLSEQQGLFRFRGVGYAPSWHCDGNCRHCFVPVRSRQRDNFCKKVEDAVFKCRFREMGYVCITGGEPFLHERRLERLIGRIGQKGLNATIVTNGLWFKDKKEQRRLIERLQLKGLKGLGLSFDAYHTPCITRKLSRSLINCCLEHGIQVGIKGTGTSSKKKIEELVVETREVVGDVEMKLYNLSDTEGRFREKDLVNNELLDGCGSALSPLVTPTGDVLACCSSWMLKMHNDVLCLGNVLDTPLDEILERASRSYVLLAIIAIGPRGVAELVNHEVLDRKENDNCEACVLMLNDSSTRNLLSRKIYGSRELRQELVARYMIKNERDKVKCDKQSCRG